MKTEAKTVDKLQGTDIPRIRRELTFFLPNSWDFNKPENDKDDFLQKPEPIANSTIHVTEEEINVTRKKNVAHPTNIAAFKF